MFIIRIIIALFICVFFQSCITLIDNGQKQIYPEFDYMDIEKVIIKADDSKFENLIADEHQINKIQKILLDSLNYFPDKELKFDGLKSKYSIKLIALKDTLDLSVYPTTDNGIVEMGFFDDYDANNEKKFRKFNRFYMNDKLLKELRKTN